METTDITDVVNSVTMSKHEKESIYYAVVIDFGGGEIQIKSLEKMGLVLPLYSIPFRVGFYTGTMYTTLHLRTRNSYPNHDALSQRRILSF